MITPRYLLPDIPSYASGSDTYHSLLRTDLTTGSVLAFPIPVSVPGADFTIEYRSDPADFTLHFPRLTVADERPSAIFLSVPDIPPETYVGTQNVAPASQE